MIYILKMMPWCLHWVKWEKTNFVRKRGQTCSSLENVDSEMPKYFGILEWRHPINDRSERDMVVGSQHLMAEALGIGEVEGLKLRPASKHSVHKLNPREHQHLNKSR